MIETPASSRARSVTLGVKSVERRHETKVMNHIQLMHRTGDGTAKRAGIYTKNGIDALCQGFLLGGH